KKIGALTYRPDDVDLLPLIATHARINYRYDLVIALVKRWPDQIVHSGVDNGEFFLRRFFQVKDAGEQHSGVPDKEPTGLDQNANVQFAQRRHDGTGIIVDAEGRWFAAMLAPPFT